VEHAAGGANTNADAPRTHTHAGTVAILAQGTSWAVAVTQAFFCQRSTPRRCPAGAAMTIDVFELCSASSRSNRRSAQVRKEDCGVSVEGQSDSWLVNEVAHSQSLRHLRSAQLKRPHCQGACGAARASFAREHATPAIDTLAEWLRRRPAKPMGSPRVGSNPTGVALCAAALCAGSAVSHNTIPEVGLEPTISSLGGRRLIH
jgi:hypothetical protein